MNTLIINAHPEPQSFSAALTNAYREGATQSGAQVETLELARLTFNPVLEGRNGYGSRPAVLEPDLEQAQQLIAWADHLVFIYPTWWGDMPALLKGFVDRTLTPGFAFRYQERSSLPLRLLRGKTARIITTMDSPVFWYRLVYGSPGTNALRRATLNYCGIRPVRETIIGSMRHSTLAYRQGWLGRVRTLGTQEGAGARSTQPQNPTDLNSPTRT